ncbi:MAG: PEP-CTERM sorting domain-containing protein [Myxococcota bacterium]
MIHPSRIAALVFGLGLLSVASVAQAASVTISSDKPSYIIGETITLTIDITIDAGESAPGAILTLFYDNGLGGASVDQGVDPITSFGGSASWTVAALQGQCDQPQLCRIVDQIAPNPTGAAVDPGYSSTAVLTFLAEGVQNWDFSFAQSTFFGAPTPTFTAFIVPEPATGALVLLGLSLMARKRRR